VRVSVQFPKLPRLILQDSLRFDVCGVDDRPPPAAHLGDPLATHAELTRAVARIGHCQHENLVAFAARAFGAVFGVSDCALQERAAQQLAGDRQTK
jgi:hypothetical protein